MISASSSLCLIVSCRQPPRMTVLGINRHSAHLETRLTGTCALSIAETILSEDSVTTVTLPPIEEHH